MNAELLVSIAATVIAVLFAYVPGFASWYQPLDPEKKRLLMAGILALVSVAALASICANLGFIEGTCEQKTAVEFFRYFIVAIVANQGAYALLPREGYAKSE